MGGMFGRPHKKKVVERHDETPAEIMARMNKLSNEIEGKHDESKYEFVDNKGQRLVQMAAVALFVVLLIVASFIMAC